MNIKKNHLSKLHKYFKCSSNILIINCITNSCIWNTYVPWQGIRYKLPGDNMIVSKHVGVW